MPLLNKGNAKTRKGEKKGFITYGLHLAPFNLSGFNVCKDASIGCAAACLNTAGRGAMSSVQLARIAKTKRFFSDKVNFISDIAKEIGAGIKSAAKNSFTPCFRLNLTSDLPWENIKVDGKSLLELFSSEQFYDYTKSPSRMSAYLLGGMPKNYHLTFSRSEENESLCLSFLKSGGNVAVVFRNRLPETWHGFPVIDGDKDDLRFLDPSGVVVGLVEKGKAKRDASGFVVEVAA